MLCVFRLYVGATQKAEQWLTWAVSVMDLTTYYYYKFWMYLRRSGSQINVNSGARWRREGEAVADRRGLLRIQGCYFHVGNVMVSLKLKPLLNLKLSKLVN